MKTTASEKRVTAKDDTGLIPGIRIGLLSVKSAGLYIEEDKRKKKKTFHSV